MPYVSQEIRTAKIGNYVQDANLNEHIDEIIAIARNTVPDEKLSGLANYIISRITTGVLAPKNYSEMADVVKTFECAKLEFVRRVMNPYEDAAIDKNGDIPEYEAFGYKKGLDKA